MTSSRYDISTLDSLNGIIAILHLFTHRNKNQHGRSLWWRHFSIFYRQTKVLEAEIAGLVISPTTNLERVAQKKAAPTVQASIEARLRSWPVSQWQHAFTQLVADGRFAQLGLVLLAALAEVCSITGVISRLEDLGEIEIQKVLDDFAEDMGTVVERDTPSTVRIRSGSRPQAMAKSNASKIISKKTKRNAIDDLFSGLG